MFGEDKTNTICNKAGNCTSKKCQHRWPSLNTMRGITGTCPENIDIRVKIIEAGTKGDPNMAFILRKK